MIWLNDKSTDKELLSCTCGECDYCKNFERCVKLRLEKIKTVTETIIEFDNSNKPKQNYRILINGKEVARGKDYETK